MSQQRNRLQKVVNWHSLATPRPGASQTPLRYVIDCKRVTRQALAGIGCELEKLLLSIGKCLLQGTLHDQQLQPFSKFAACFGQQADLLKPERCVQRD